MNLCKTICALIFLSIVAIGCKNLEKKGNSEPKSTQSMKNLVNKLDGSDFKTTIEGDSVALYTIRNRTGIEATFTNYGQRLISLYTPDKEGNMKDIVLGFPTLEEYLNAKEKYFGATIGRYGNRIAKGKFSIDGESYTLATNNGENHLHGGVKGFNDVVWNAKNITENGIEFTRTSPDMEEGYPGNLEVKVRYLLTDSNELKITYTATTDKKTVVNLTHHSFFNLKGEGEGNVNDHLLMINADSYTPVDEALIPNGSIAKVMGTPFDFTQLKAIGKDLEVVDRQLEFGRGYDHNFILNATPKTADGLTLAAKVIEPTSGRVVEVYTNEPGIQFYGGNFLDGNTIGKSGKPYLFRGAFCLETQHYPDSPNQPNFPSTILNPSEVYSSICVYKFSNVK